MASCTCTRADVLTRTRPVRTRETVAAETPAAAATSVTVGCCCGSSCSSGILVSCGSACGQRQPLLPRCQLRVSHHGDTHRSAPGHGEAHECPPCELTSGRASAGPDEILRSRCPIVGCASSVKRLATCNRRYGAE